MAIKEDRPFLSRWSNRKRQVRQEEEADGQNLAEKLAEKQAEKQAQKQAERGPASGAFEGGEANEALSPGLLDEESRPLSEEEVEALPDPETLNQGDDFKVYLREGVPEFLKRKALRRLWRVNPLIAEVDGLLDYGEDFTDKATVVANIQTVFKVGRGVVLPEEEEAEARAKAAAEAGLDPDAQKLATPNEEAAAPGEEAAVSSEEEAAEKSDEPEQKPDEEAIALGGAPAPEPMPLAALERAKSPGESPGDSPGDSLADAPATESPASCGQAARKRWQRFL